MLEKDDKIGDYTLINFLGRGQFGEVWLAEKQLQFSTRKFRHALKFLSNRGGEINLKTIEAEIDSWIEASGHPNVMSVLDMLVHKNCVVIVSEFAEGGSIRNWLDKNGGKAPSNEKALEMMIGVLRGIEHLHSRNVVHRDLKPDNILLQGNFPRIADFGISRIVSESGRLTGASGSPAYMSPESFHGNKSSQNDIWSAGVILYEMLSGDFPYEHENIYGLISQIQQDQPKPLPEHIPQNLRLIVGTALQKDRAKRFQTAREMRIAVEKALYNLKTAEKEKTLPDNTNQFPTLPLIKKDEKIREYDIETEKLLNNETELIETQPEIENAQGTQGSQINNSQDWEKPKLEKKRRGLLAVIGGGILGSTLIVVLIWVAGDKKLTRLNTNSAKNNSITSADNSTKTNALSAPIEMVEVPGGEFMMGSNNGYPDEKPMHRVSINYTFYIGKYEITQAQWKAVMKNNPSYFKGDDLPVEQVSWSDAKDFIRKLNYLQTEYEYRLPSEAEWEYACRAGTTGDYAGNLNSIAWYSKNSDSKTHPVGQKQANAFELYDMHGNVWEWCEDIYTKDGYQELPADDSPNLRNPSILEDNEEENTRKPVFRVYRGGSWALDADGVRSAIRNWDSPVDRSTGVGFRVVARVK
jgi:formylglycine-generating enzyme required for sulfatase activity